MIDEVFEDLSSRLTDGEWTSLEELSGILKKQGLNQDEAEGVMRFLRRYFLEVDEIGRRARLNSWAHGFSSIPRP